MLGFSNYNKAIKKYLFLAFFISIHALANGQLTHLQKGISIYSEYYPNSLAKFKGTIIFENGSGTDISEWKSNKKFFNCVKKAGSVFMYDRNGLGKSPPDIQVSNNNPITAKLVSEKLLILIKKLNIKPPYIVVAHSAGAMYAGYFTLKNPNLVKGLLLIDPSPREFYYPNKIMKKFEMGMEEARVKSSAYMELRLSNGIFSTINLMMV